MVCISGYFHVIKSWKQTFYRFKENNKFLKMINKRKGGNTPEGR